MANNSFIDAHTHVWTPDLSRYPLADGFTCSDMKPPSFTRRQLLKHAEDCGVGRAVLIQMTFHGFDNSYVLDVIRDAPDQFVGVAVVDQNAKDLGDQLATLVTGGIVGLRLIMHGLDADAWIETASAQNVFRELLKMNLAACFLGNPDKLAAVDRVCKQYSELKVVIDHMSRIGAEGNLNSENIARLCNLARHKNVYVKVSAFYALGKAQPPYLDLLPMIRELRDAFGAERLMWASDCPFQVDPGHTYRESLELITEHAEFLSDGDRQHLLQGTAEKVFFHGSKIA